MTRRPPCAVCGHDIDPTRCIEWTDIDTWTPQRRHHECPTTEETT